MNSPLLEKISQPSDLKKLSSQQTVQLCAEIREFLLDNVSKTGGHLASNLGAVELTVALHRVLTTPTDEIVFDVGHQCYTHKLLTGRREALHAIRMTAEALDRGEPAARYPTGRVSGRLALAGGLARWPRLGAGSGAGSPRPTTHPRTPPCLAWRADAGRASQ